MHDPDVLPVTRLLGLLKKGQLVDDEHKDSVKELYDGQQQVAVDTKTILEAIVELQRPEKGFYDVPMIIAYPRLSNGRLEIGVYASRLLFEIMTTSSLQCIVLAFDDDSINITRPLSYPKPSPVPVFASDDRRIVYRKNDFSAKDATIEGATDDTDSLYAFSNAGLMRLCESHGNDTSNWSEIEAKLPPTTFTVQLTLHQKHGVCWMKMMENIDGGLNSIIWEQREFLDGGYYYWSPALGQARLFLGTTPEKVQPIVKGGLLCDEVRTYAPFSHVGNAKPSFTLFLLL